MNIIILASVQFLPLPLPQSAAKTRKRINVQQNTKRKHN